MKVTFFVVFSLKQMSSFKKRKIELDDLQAI